MRVVISGGTGFIGRALSADLLRDGHDVVVLARDPERALRALPDGARALAWDARTAGDWAAEVDGSDAVVHLAGAGIADARWTAARKQVIRDSRFEGTRAIARAVEQVGRRPRVVVQASAVGVYGPRDDEELDETAPPGKDFLASEVVVPVEREAAKIRGLGVRVPVARSGVVLGMDGGALPRLILPFRLFVGGRIGSGRQVLSWIHLADEVAALRYLVSSDGADGPYNLTAPRAVTNAQFARTAGRVLGRPAVIPVPAAALRIGFGEMATALLDGQRAVPRRLLDEGFAFRFPDLEAALRDLLCR